MATTTTTATVQLTIKAVDMDTVGWSTGRCPVDEVQQYHWQASHHSKTWTFARMDEQWYGLCWKCAGAGNIGYGPDNGRCWECMGHGVRDYWTQGEEFETKLRNIERNVKAESTKQRKAMEKRQAEIAAWREANAELVTWAEALTPTGDEPNPYAPEERQDVFSAYSDAVQVAIRAVRWGGDLERKSTGLLRKVMADDAARPQVDPGRHAGAKGERVAITGEVTMIRQYDDADYLAVKVEGRGADQGITFFTNTSSASAYELAEGDLVTIKATIKCNEDRRGVRSDRVGRAVFTKVDAIPTAPEAPSVAETAPAAPVEAPAPTAPASEPKTPQGDAKPARKTGRREALGASSVDGWELLYDKPKAGAEVVRQDGRYALACKAHKTLHHLARLSDEGAVRKAGGWCTECH
jgi:hypothetical protein